VHDAPRPSRRPNRPSESDRARAAAGEPARDHASRAPATGLRVAEVLRAGAPSALALGVWTVAGGGCASAPTANPLAGPGGEVRAPLEIAATGESPASGAAVRRPDRVVFSDDATTDPRGGASMDEPSGGLVSALASSYADDQAALAAMEAARREPSRVVFSDEADLPAQDRGFSRENAAEDGVNAALGGNFAPEPRLASRGGDVAPIDRASAGGSTESTAPGREGGATTAANPSDPRESGASVSDALVAPAVGPAVPSSTMTPATTPATTPPVNPAPVATTAGDATTVSEGGAIPATTPVADAPAQAAPTAANLPLEIVEPTPTEPAPLARLLAESLVRSSGESVEPLREWIAYSALALTDPSIDLPAGFGHDLLPAEKARVEAVHAAFAAVGRSLAEGSTELDPATIEALVAALGGGPKLAIPRTELCTKVERFGQFAPIASRKFLARSNARFIVYSELDGFSSALEGGRFVTRLASRVSIETDRDGVEVWRRSPEWTAVVDASEVRRDEFFVAEIVPLNEYLSVGSYRLKVELRDEATGATATSTVPFHIVADPSMAAVGD
jgi:hypothetical protein